MKGRHYTEISARAVDHDTKCVELHWDDGRVAQLAGGEHDDPRGQFLLLRVWPTNGTVEYGGDNGDSVTIHLVPEGRGWKIKSLGVHEVVDD